MESEEDPWAGMGMDEDEEILPKEQIVEEEVCEECSLGQDKDGRPPVDDWPLLGSPSFECSEPRPLQMKRRIADVILTFPAALEHAQIDKAMAAVGIAQNLEESSWPWEAEQKSVQAASGQATSQGLRAGSYDRQQADLECLSPKSGKRELLQLGTHGSCWVISWKAQVNFKCKCNVFKGTEQGALRFVRFFRAKMEALPRRNFVL